MRTKKAWAVVVATALVTTLFATAAGAENPWEPADIFEQGSTSNVLVDDGAKINRTPTGLSVSVSMPTPEPGTYALPPESPVSSDEHGSPAAFSLWAFIFFNPGACVGGCGGDDLMRANDALTGRVVAGAFNVGGHLVSGPQLTISGKANQSSTLFGGPNAESIATALNLGYSIEGAEIHIAVAPHGKLDASKMPEQISTPAGNPSFWWVALYK